MLLENFKRSKLITFFGLSSFQILAMFRRGLFYTYLSIYLRDFLFLSVTETTLYATLPMIMSVLFQNFVWGPISDKLQRRRTLIILGEILAGGGTLLVWLIHNSFSDFYIAGYIIIIGLSCIELFWSMSNIGWSALISDIYPSVERSKVMGRLTSVGGFGRIIGITIGGVLYNNGFGFRDGPLFFVASFIMFISTFPMLFAPEGGIEYSKNIEKDESLEINEKAQFRYKNIFIIFIISLIFINFGRNSISIPYSQYLSLESGFGVDSVLLSLIVNTRSVAVILVGLGTGILSNKIGHSKSLIFGVILALFALLINTITNFLWMIFLGSFLFGASEVIIYSASYAIASDLIPENYRGKLFGLYNTTFFLSWGLACTLISGPLIDFLININISEIIAYQSSFLVGAILTFVGLIIYIISKLKLAIKKRKNK
ncbi:MAG: MFS transporter [Candidatus Lokiarchaeota archaeon]|nr:MFS transporter [Candidatus Lokiarchaeota archaeon]MBD3199297.1 MFS transporter [Candidatus Lokiarchaeota archaeon]